MTQTCGEIIEDMVGFPPKDISMSATLSTDRSFDSCYFNTCFLKSLERRRDMLSKLRRPVITQGSEVL